MHIANAFTIKWRKIIIFSISFLVGCTQGNEELSMMPKEIVFEKLSINYNINTETLCLIYNLSDAGDLLFTQNPSPRATLARALTKKFERFKRHEAVLKLNHLLQHDLVDLYDVDLSLFHSQLPEYRQKEQYPFDYYVSDSIKGDSIRRIFDGFSRSVRKFYMDAKLDSFIRIDMKDIYRNIISEVNPFLPSENYIKAMEEYFGVKRHSYTVVISAFAFNGIGRSKTIHTPEGIDVYQLVSSNPKLESDTFNFEKANEFVYGYGGADYFRELVTHELIHSFLNEAFHENDFNEAKINGVKYLFTEKLQKSMASQGYTDWHTCFEEHLVRVCEIRIAQILGYVKFAKEYRRTCIENRGFVYIPELEEIIQYYELNRSSYLSMETFIPQMIEKLKKKTCQ